MKTATTFTEVPDAREVARMRLETICERACLSEEHQEIVWGIVEALIQKMSGQLREAGLASASMAEVAIMLRNVKELNNDIEMSHLERMLVTAIVGAIAVEFRQRGYCVKNRYGVVVSLV